MADSDCLLKFDQLNQEINDLEDGIRLLNQLNKIDEENSGTLGDKEAVHEFLFLLNLTLPL